MQPPESGRVVHLELHTSDATDARGFYAELCGWRTRRVDTATGSYLAVGLGDSIGGGIVQCPTPRPVWLPYVEVPDIVEMTDRARRCGARVVIASREGPAGWRSVISTAAGGEIALWQPKR
jgi:predicted enzyme related to lactoylglutathione lyase